MTRNANPAIIPELERKAKSVQLRNILALASSFAALSLGACSTTMTLPSRAVNNNNSATTVAGTYLAANFAAAQGDVKSATNFYANSLKDDPGNADLLERTFLFAAEAAEIEQAISLTGRVLEQDSTNRPAHLVLEIGALAKKDYATVIKDTQTPSPGLFAALTNRIIEAWARAGSRDFDGALTALDAHLLRQHLLQLSANAVQRFVRRRHPVEHLDFVQLYERPGTGCLRREPHREF